MQVEFRSYIYSMFHRLNPVFSWLDMLFLSLAFAFYWGGDLQHYSQWGQHPKIFVLAHLFSCLSQHHRGYPLEMLQFLLYLLCVYEQRFKDLVCYPCVHKHRGQSCTCVAGIRAPPEPHTNICTCEFIKGQMVSCKSAVKQGGWE